MAKQKRVAIFDIDGTIFRSSLLIELVEALVGMGIFAPTIRRGYAREERAWQHRCGSYEAYITAVVHTFMRYIKGVHYGDFAEAAKLVIKENRDATYCYTRDLIAQYKKRGYFLLAISHSPKVIVDRFAKQMGFNKAYGMMYEIGPSDRITGAIIDEHIIRNKGNVLRRVLEKEGLSLKHSIAVGDTEGDIPMLELVDKPICFNPNKNLYRVAKRNGWRIVVERKDVIYTLS